MSSVMNTFKWVLPLWTMNVWPTNSGTIVQARAHVLMGSFRPVLIIRSTLTKSLGSTNGPFLSERDIGRVPANFSGAHFYYFHYRIFNCPYRRERRRRTI